jgi:hypothetical protein
VVRGGIEDHLVAQRDAGSRRCFRAALTWVSVPT